MFRLHIYICLGDYEEELGSMGGRYLLHYTYTGSLSTDMLGMYVSTYTDDKGKGKNILATQFEPYYARRFLPSFDEPSFKAVLQLTVLDVPVGHTALSNMPRLNKAGAPSTSYFFAPSPPMSTYLFALVMGPLESQPSAVIDDRNVKIWTKQGFAKFTTYATDVAIATLQYFESYLNVPFPLPKLDIVAIPDFAAGAMENWVIYLFTYYIN